MAQPLTYYSGLQTGLQSLASQEATRLENEQRQAQTSQLRAQMAREEQERQTLSQIFNAQTRDELAVDDIQGTASLANRYEQAGKAIIGVNPKAGMDFINQASNLRKDAGEKVIKDLQYQQTKAEIQGETLFNIRSQEDLEAAIPTLNKLGTPIPERYRDYSNPETQAWLQKTALRSKNVREAIQLEQAASRIELQTKATESEIKAREDRQRNADRNYQLNRDKITRGKTQKQPTLTETGFQIELLNKDPLFKGLKETDQLEAARDVIYLANAYVLDGTARNMQDAETLARQSVTEAIDPETGRYLREKAGETTSQPTPKGKGPTIEEFLTKAKAANPNATEEQLKAYYQQTYGTN